MIKPDPDNSIEDAGEQGSSGEESISGSTPAPDKDDDTLANEQAVGLHLDEDPEHPKPLDIGKDIDDAEKYKHTH